MEKEWHIYVELDGYSLDTYVSLDTEEYEGEQEVIEWVLDNIIIYADEE